MCEVKSPTSNVDKIWEVMQAPGQIAMEGEHNEEPSRDIADVNVGDVIPYCALFCGFDALYCKTPNCFGCNTNGEVLCCFSECTGCKCIAPSSNADGICCIFCKGSENCIKPRTCCGGNAQFFCCYEACALPPTKDVPVLCNVLGLNCVGGTGCCKKVADLQPDRYGPNAGKL